MKRSAAAIAAFLSRLGVDRAPSFVVRVSLRRAQKTANSDQKLAPPIGGSNKPAPHDVNAAASKVRVQLRFDSALLARADVAANRQGITRTAWLHRAAFDALEGRVSRPAE
jgi:hypothetical protein